MNNRILFAAQLVIPFWYFIGALSACTAAQTDSEIDRSSGFSQGAVLGQFKNTYYYLVLESDYPDQELTEEVLNMQDEVLLLLGRKFKAAMDIEGSGKLRDGRVLNYAGFKSGMTRYHFTDFPYGHGVGSCGLIPFHTVAVDPTLVRLGSVVQIDETVGMLLPDGTRHDGLWRAEDIGGAIKEHRVDLFVGAGDQGWVLHKAGIQNMKPLTLRLVASPPEHPCTERPAGGFHH